MPWVFDCTYPGAANIRSLRYVTSVGISAGTIDIACHPASTPAPFGALTFGVTDGFTTRTLTLPDCLLDKPSGGASKGDQVLNLRLYDRRWMWADRFPVYGHYNQQDDHQKLVPRTVRSPYQMAVMLLTAMGEPTPGGGWEAAIDLPPGLAVPADVGLGIPAPATYDELIDGVEDYLKCGENYTRSRTNPVSVWEATPAAVALARLVEQFGRLVVLDPLTDAVSIQQYGSGTPLPAGRQIQNTTAFDLEAVPSAVTAAGSATRHQVRLRTRAVGREWDTSWQPLDRLSYAPGLPTTGRVMKVEAEPYGTPLTWDLYLNGVKFSAAGTPAATIAAQITASTDPRVLGLVTAGTSGSKLLIDGVANGYEFRVRGPADRWRIDCTEGPLPDPVSNLHRFAVTFTLLDDVAITPTVTIAGTPYTAGPDAADVALAALAASITAGASANATVSGRVLRIDGKAVGVDIGPVTATCTPPTLVEVTVQEITPETSVRYGFHQSVPGHFPDVRAGKRLNYEEAKAAAAGSVFTCYQVVLENPNDAEDKSIPMPGGVPVISNRHDLSLLPSRVEQIEPSHGDADIVDPRTGQPYAQDTYSGYAADRDPAAYGGIHAACWNGLFFRPAGGLGPNTTDEQRIPVSFSIIDPIRQVVRFDRPIYRMLGKGNKTSVVPADPVIEIGVLALDPETFAPRRLQVTVAIPGAVAPPVTRVFEDVREEIVGEYDQDHNLTGARTNDADPVQRATTYAVETALKYQQPASQTIGYNNMEAIGLSGLVRQVEWSFGRDGFRTTASSNSEFSRIVLPYGERRRTENLTPDAQRAMENVLSNPLMRNLPRNPAAAALGGATSRMTNLF